MNSSTLHLSGSASARAWDDLTLRPEARTLLALAEAKPVLDRIFDASPFLTGLIMAEPAFAATCFKLRPDELIGDLCSALAAASQAAESEADMRRLLRQARSRAALAVAVADLSGRSSIEEVTQGLTAFAEAALQASVDWLLRAEAAKGRLILPRTDPGSGSGYAVLGMGKLGACELNYSSDIDLIVLYDPERAPLAEGIEPGGFFVRLTKKLVSLLQETTEDGYAFRVDLRLRPDPRATQIAMSVEAAGNYYESMGQNWERAAMVKARAVAGDIALGEEFLSRLVPYVWRKYLDFAAIADIQSLKRQIHAVKGHGAIRVRGHNIKLGRGGIREIEFFVQTQQLIAGGRNPKLRGRRTLDMLSALADAQWISPAARDELSNAYRQLRTLEHRLQMIADEQTHTIPEADEAFERLVRFAGYDSGEIFEANIRTTLETVQRHYRALFKDAEELSSDEGSLVFTGGEDDPETIATLRAMGFREASEISATIRGWHFGRYHGTRSARARERLTEIMPALLAALARHGDPDQAFFAFDRFLAGLPTGVQLFSMLRSNPDLLDLIAAILGAAPRLAGELSRRPKVLDAVLDPGFFGALPAKTDIAAAMNAAIPPETPLEEAIDRARVIAKEQMFRIGVRVLTETVGATEAGGAFSDLADVVLQQLHEAVARDMSARFGAVPGGKSAVLALGKLGSREMAAGSDLDLIVIYDSAEAAESVGGRKSLSVNQYYARFTQRLIAALTAPTAEGVLYDVDLRLRPSGNKGPVATSLASFRSYHETSAWTWERLALTRARVVAGDEDLGAKIEDAIAGTIEAAREPRAILADVLAMRGLMLKEQKITGVWDIKRARGGLVEIEFIAQTMQLLHAAENPAIRDPNTARALEKLTAEGVLDQRSGSELREACRLYQRLTQVLRLCVDGPFDPATAPVALNRIAASIAGTPDIASAEEMIRDTQHRVVELFDRLIGRIEPAA